ncbi:rod shape-determining protein MreD [Thiomicrorhabdus sp. 6S2-11]|uniref:Rod shape-determining protein MreD n=1 Tax=Thiomicrorhabdus marina TaxID=2818442 RepID=A0ABS3Q1N0_9GAMM|nr:rod shape-determining protein MreD [Thiomicrorhabdus marina]MBO1926191.1 rod shape-determining protein MreD [Thiomicrorhabdus marina]
MGDNFIYISSRQVRWLIILSFVIALVLDSINLIGASYQFLPPFTLLVLLYWSGHFLDYTYISTAFVIGLLADTLYQTTLGMHALIYVTLTFTMLRHRLHFRGYSVIQQALNIIVFMFIFQVLHLLILSPTLDDNEMIQFWSMPVVSAFLWLIFAKLLNLLTQQNAIEN